MASWNAFTLMIKNAFRFGIGNSIGYVYMFFGCIFIASLTCFGSYIFMTNYDGLGITSPLPATVVIAVISIAIAYQFLSIFSFSSDAIF